MVTRLRLKGRMLLIDNAVLISLLLGTTLMFLVCANFFVLLYELLWRGHVETVLTSYVSFADLLVALVIFILSYTVCCQVKLGTDRYFFRQSRKKGASPKDLFYYFNPRRAFGALLFCVKLRFIRTLWLIVAAFPSAMCLLILLNIAEKGVSALVALALAVGTILFIFSGLCFYRNVTASLFLAKYHFIAGDCISFRQMICASEESMRQRKGTLLRLKLSFVGWFLLCLLILPVGYVWGYYNQTLAVAAGEFIEG